MRYFAYGSNMSLNRLRQRVPSAVPIGIFSLPKHKLIFHKVGKDGTAKCNAYLTHDPSDMIIGRLYETDADEKSILDRVEGLGYGYDEKVIKVFNTKTSFKATTYYATNMDNTLKPFTWYKKHVLVGAYEANLPKAYINIIEAIPAVADYDTRREAQELSIHY